MEKVVLNSQVRENGETAKALRAAKTVPAVVYGHNQENVHVKVGNSDLLRAYRSAGKNHIIELVINEKKVDVLFHDVQFAPVSGDIIHVDFYVVVKGEKVHTSIPLSFTGISKAKTEEGAIIEELVKQIEVKCLPTDLVDSFNVDLSKLEHVGDNIKVSDLVISSKFEVLSPADEVVALAAKSKVEKTEDTNAA